MSILSASNLVYRSLRKFYCQIFQLQSPISNPMTIKVWKQITRFWFFLVSTLILFLVFDQNIFQSVETDHFNSFQWDSEGLVVARMARSKKEVSLL